MIWKSKFYHQTKLERCYKRKSKKETVFSQSKKAITIKCHKKKEEKDGKQENLLSTKYIQSLNIDR